MVHACNPKPRTWRAETENAEFLASFGYILRPCLTKLYYKTKNPKYPKLSHIYKFEKCIKHVIQNSNNHR
jgi:hypothetical protein